MPFNTGSGLIANPPPMTRSMNTDWPLILTGSRAWEFQSSSILLNPDAILHLLGRRSMIGDCTWTGEQYRKEGNYEWIGISKSDNRHDRDGTPDTPGPDYPIMQHPGSRKIGSKIRVGKIPAISKTRNCSVFWDLARILISEYLGALVGGCMDANRDSRFCRERNGSNNLCSSGSHQFKNR